jgi:predicted flap endonuclease-1-like 5' DNA nuclease
LIAAKEKFIILIQRRNGMASLIKIEGIGEKYATKLKMVGISTTEALLDKGRTPKGRKEIAEKSGITETLILEWINLADLFRIKGVGEEYSDLMEEAGVDTVVELAQRNPTNLYESVVAINNQKKLVRKLPSQAQIGDWVKQAKKLPRVVSYK